MIRISMESRDLEDLIEDQVKQWRAIYQEEIERGPSRTNVVSKPSFEHFTSRERPFFNKINREDKLYLKSFRSIEYSAIKYNLSSKIVIMRLSGYRLGTSLVEKGFIKSLDDMPLALATFKIGLVDIISESFNNMKINIYECLSCYGIPNIGRAMCDFEAGVIQGVLSKLYGSNTVKERYCWGLGYSFCRFDVFFE